MQLHPPLVPFSSLPSPPFIGISNSPPYHSDSISNYYIYIYISQVLLLVFIMCLLGAYPHNTNTTVIFSLVVLVNSPFYDTLIPRIHWIPGYDNTERLVNGVTAASMLSFPLFAKRVAVPGVPFHHHYLNTFKFLQVLAAIIETNPMSSRKISSGLPIAVSLDELARAMGLTPTVSAGLLYHAILQVQAPPYTPRPPTMLAQRKALLQRK
jgi:hypothetical protein